MDCILTKVVEVAKTMGFNNVSTIKVMDIKTDEGFHTMCKQNACGNYGRCYTCPPDVGVYNNLVTYLKEFDTAVVYQTISPLEDSYDYEGMMEAGKKTSDLAKKLHIEVEAICEGHFLHLGAGGCRLCAKCGKIDNIPCRFPKQATASLEAYGIDVTTLSKLAGMNYINGQDTVTYFGAFFLKE